MYADLMLIMFLLPRLLAKDLRRDVYTLVIIPRSDAHP